jgi:formate dehydrogenase major subunit
MRSISETDLGTPKSKSTQQVTLTIDGHDITVPAGTSVLRAAAEIGIQIPKLCATELLDAFGSCRLCLVQIEGMKGYPASCTTPVAAGMKVTTQNDTIAELRHGVMELYLSDHPFERIATPAGGHTDIADMAEMIGVREVRYGFDGANHVQPKRADARAARDAFGIHERLILARRDF